MILKRGGTALALALIMTFAGGAHRAGADDKGRAKAEQLAKDGDAQLLMGDDAAAAQLYKDAIAADPAYTHASLRLAFVEAKLGHDDEAVKLLEEITGKADAPPEAFQILGTVLAKRREWRKAAVAFETYLGKVPGDYRARRELAKVYAALAPEDKAASAKAVTAYQQAIKDAGDDDSFKNLAQEEMFTVKYGVTGRAYLDGRTAYANGDYRGAVKQLELVTKDHPEIEEAQYLLGMAYLTPEINRRDDAKKAWAKAPNLKEAQLHLGMELHADGDISAAEKRLEGAIALDADYQEAWYYLGVIYAEKGDNEKAAKAWERAMQIDPNSETGKWAGTKWSMVNAQGANSGVFMEGQVIDPASETVMGQKFEKMAVDYFGGVIEDERLTTRMDGIFDRLVVATDRGDLTYRVHLVNSTEINAFSAPGGQIFVTRGLIDAIRTRMGDKDEYYAAVLGHELAHSTLRHVPERWKYVQTVINDPNASRAELDRAFASVATGMTRQQEYEADQYGALYMYRAGFNPRYSMDLHVQFVKVVGEIPEGLDHPTFGDRAARLKDFLIEMRGRVREFDRGNKKFKDGDYAGAARSYEVFLAVLPKNAPAHMNLGLARHRQALARLGSEQKYKRSTDLDPDAKVAAIELHSTGDKEKPDPRIDKQLMRQAAAEYKTALRLNPDYTLARVNYGALLLDMGETKTATKVLERAVKFSPKSAMAWNNLGVAYLMGKNKKAEKTLQEAAKVDPKLADPHYNLGVMYADAGKTDKAMASFEQYATLDKDSGWARKARNRKAELAEGKAGKKGK